MLGANAVGDKGSGMSFQRHTGADRIAALMTRGNAFASKAQYLEAIKCYEQILAKSPGHLDAINNRGNCLTLLGRHDRAVKSYDTILAARPNDLRARNNRAIAFKQLGRISEALAEFDAILKLDPNNADTLYHRGNMFSDLSRPTEAVRDLRRALALNPGDATTHTSLIFALNFDPEATSEELHAARATWGARYDGSVSGVAHTNEPRAHRGLRVGYVSAHFRHQAATYSFGGVITHHDPRQFEVVCYSDTEHEDDLTQHLRAHVHKWHRTARLSDDELGSLIRTDRIDILVDLVGHMKGHRLPTFARKPAPVQVTGWGEPTGTGLKAIDYVFADPVVIPTSERPLLREQVADLPNFIGYWSPEPLPAPQPPPALTQGYVTFGSFNRLAKVLPAVLQSWAAILRALPESRLVLKGRLVDRGSQETPILTALANEGIAAERVTILDQGGRADHFAAYHGLDIALDPFPHSGGMTTLDALSMGVPVVTCPGRTISSRLAAACLTAAGLDDWIASDRDRYIDLAIAKTRDLGALAELRGALRSRIADSEFGDPRKYTRAVEAQYRAMWRRWCAGQDRSS
jgi:predicted O-linked N-acetylglucosamine transferase (SPINDLY family)